MHKKLKDKCRKKNKSPYYLTHLYFLYTQKKKKRTKLLYFKLVERELVYQTRLQLLLHKCR